MLFMRYHKVHTHIVLVRTSLWRMSLPLDTRKDYYRPILCHSDMMDRCLLILFSFPFLKQLASGSRMSCFSSTSHCFSFNTHLTVAFACASSLRVSCSTSHYTKVVSSTSSPIPSNISNFIMQTMLNNVIYNITSSILYDPPRTD